MSYTSHGHHIPGTTRDTEVEDTRRVMKCGGPKICGVCKTESIAALPEDSIASADLRGDLAALTDSSVPNQHPSGLPVEWKRKLVCNEEFMEFVDTPEGRENIMNWLHLNRIESAFWPGNPDTKTKPRIQFLLANHTVHLEIFPGQYLRKTHHDWMDRPIEKVIFEVVRPEEVESYFEPSCAVAPVPWIVETN